MKAVCDVGSYVWPSHKGLAHKGFLEAAMVVPQRAAMRPSRPPATESTPRICFSAA